MKDVILKRVVAISLLVGAAYCHAAGQYEEVVAKPVLA